MGRHPDPPELESRGFTVPAVIYDGDCPICRNTVDWIRRKARPGAFEFLPCGSDEAARRFPFIEKEACLKAIHVVRPAGEHLTGYEAPIALVGEQAVPEILRRLPRYRFLAALFRLPGAGLLSRAFYRWFARRRYPIAHLLFPRHKT